MTTTDLEDTLELPLTLRVPRSTLVLVAAPPATVTQKTAQTHFGIPENAFKAMGRQGLFPVKRIGRLLFASYEAVRAAVTEGAEQRARFQKAVSRARHAVATTPIEIEEAARYMASAASPAEFRQRRAEVHAIASDLLKQHDETREDGSPNPDYDKRLRDHAFGLYYQATVEDIRRRPPRRRKNSP